MIADPDLRLHRAPRNPAAVARQRRSLTLHCAALKPNSTAIAICANHPGRVVDRGPFSVGAVSRGCFCRASSKRRTVSLWRREDNLNLQREFRSQPRSLARLMQTSGDVGPGWRVGRDAMGRSRSLLVPVPLLEPVPREFCEPTELAYTVKHASAAVNLSSFCAWTFPCAAPHHRHAVGSHFSRDTTLISLQNTLQEPPGRLNLSKRLSAPAGY